MHPFGGYQTVSPFVMVIFGATGDLTARKLMPALYNLLNDKILPERFFVVGFARRPMGSEEFRHLMREAVTKELRTKNLELRTWQKLEKNLYYQQGYFEDKNPYKQLINLLKTFDDEIGACITRFFYLATPPQNYSAILAHLDSSKLSEGCGQGSKKWTRVLIEKPFGKDLETSKKLEEQLSSTFEERQIYRIDHYLAKETIQNLLAFRFANGIFEPIWNRSYIDHIQITLAESGGVGNRGAFYEGVGAIRDVAQNHLMAMLAYTTMEEPQNMSADAIRTERVKALKSVRKFTLDDVKNNIVRGQYGSENLELKTKNQGLKIENNKMMKAYREEANVDPKSNTETFIALKLFIDNNRWRGVPFYLRTGKRLAKSEARISIQFKKPHNKIFSEFDRDIAHSHFNVLTFRVQPKEGISLQMLAKKPGLGYSLRNVKMDFSYEKEFGSKIFDSYERLLIDCMRADQTLFATGEGFRITWSRVSYIMDAWKKIDPPKFPNYSAGSWGPAQAEDLIETDGRHWLLH